jgi:hypothetical protein
MLVISGAQLSRYGRVGVIVSILPNCLDMAGLARLARKNKHFTTKDTKEEKKKEKLWLGKIRKSTERDPVKREGR